MKAKIALICCVLLIIVGAAHARMTVIGVAGVVSGEEPASCSGVIGSEETTATTYATENVIYITRFALGCSGSNPTAYARFQYVSTTDRELIVVAYNDVPGDPPEPGTLIGATDPFYDAGNNTAQTLNLGTLTGSFSGDYVWIGIQYEYSGSKPSWVATGGATREYAGTFDSPPAEWPTASDTATEKVVNAYVSF